MPKTFKNTQISVSTYAKFRFLVKQISIYLDLKLMDLIYYAIQAETN